jgi:hypothetical protein
MGKHTAASGKVPYDSASGTHGQNCLIWDDGALDLTLLSTRPCKISVTFCCSWLFQCNRCPALKAGCHRLNRNSYVRITGRGMCCAHAQKTAAKQNSASRPFLCGTEVLRLKC